MRKKVMIVALALVLASLFTFVAYASVASKTASDMGQVSSVRVVDPLTGQTLFVNNLSVAVVENSPAAVAELNNIQSFYTANGGAVIGYFDDAVVEEIAALLPVGFNTNNLVLNEFVMTQIFGSADGLGILEITFDFATEFSVGQNVVAVIGVFDAQGNVEWIAQEAYVQMDDDGVARVKVRFTQDVLEKVAENPFAVAILSE